MLRQKGDFMDHLTVKEVAELKGCSERYVQQLIKKNKLGYVSQPNPYNNHYLYMIPVSALSEELQLKYYKKQRTGAGLLPETKDEKPKKPQRSFEELSADEREEIALWTEILKEWQGMRNTYKGSKTEFDKLYVGKCQLEHTDIKVSADILYRKWRAYKDNDIEGLIDKRGAWNKGNKKIPVPVWEYFLWLWLDENQPTASLCYRMAIDWTREFYPELLGDIPTERSFRRQLDRDVAYAVKVYMREGEKAFKDRCAPYMIRFYDELEANDCWIADNHTLDIISSDGETRHRLYLTAFIDAKSEVMTGWNITESPCSDSTILALRHGIERFGIPKLIYMDNGREFLNHDIGGTGHRTKKSMKDQPDPPPIFKRLGIEMRNAIVRNARAKPIERTFCTLKEQFSKLWNTFCGGKITERKESLKYIIKRGDIPRDYQIREVIGKWIDGVYNCQPYGGSERCFTGMSRIDVWNRTIKTVTTASPADLNLMLMRSSRYQKIGRNGVYITVAGQKLYYMDSKQTLMNQEHEVYIRYNPADLRTVRIYDKDTDRFMFEWKIADMLMADFLDDNIENIADGQEIISRSRKFIRDEAKGITANLTNEQKIDLIAMSVQNADRNISEKFSINMPKNIEFVKADEKELPEKQVVGGENIDIIDISQRIMKNASERKE